MNPSHNLRNVKPDLSPFLFHFTKGDNPFDNIITIIKEKQLICNMRGADSSKAVCFTESPLTLSGNLFNYMYSKARPLYSKYGIGFKRDVMIRDYGARPVIYGDSNEYKLLPEELKWRYVRLDVDKYDFQWQREWRTKGKVFDFTKLSIDDIIIVAPTKEDLEKIVAFQDFEELDFDYDHGECFPCPIYKLTRELKGISFEDLSVFYNDKELEKETDTQKIGETLQAYNKE